MVFFYQNMSKIIKTLAVSSFLFIFAEDKLFATIDKAIILQKIKELII